MKNADSLASPIPKYNQNGLTKREHFCLHAGVPATGDDELDAIIREGERRRIAREALNGMMSGAKTSLNEEANQTIVRKSVIYADALLAELEKGEG